MKLLVNLLPLSCLVALLAGCAANSPAPVIDRGSSQSAAEKAAPVELKPGEYMVKKGDTLYGIALDHGQDHREIASWNNLDNPNLIRIGQILRIAPPESEAGGTAELKPIAPPVQIENRADNPAAASTGKPSVSEALKREPKGGTQPYSDAAWAQLQQPVAATPAAAAPSPSLPLPGKPAEPTKSAPAGDIDWGWPTDNKTTAMFSGDGNKGMDFNGAVGDPVVAAAAGKVTLVTNSLRGYGNLIVVKHNTSYLSVYAHNSKMLVKEGQTVSKGQKIAEIGSTDSDRPNLHFEIRREGKPVDPAKFLPQR